MKFNPLTLAILLATSTTLISCDDDKKPETKKETPVAVEQQKMNAEELANVAEARYKNLVTLNNRILADVNISKHSPWKDIKTVVDSYERHENGATAKETATITPNEDFAFINKPVVMTSLDTITYSPKLLKEGIVASIDHDIDASQFVASSVTSENIKAILQNVFTNFVFHTDLLVDDNAKSTIKIKPFNTSLSNSDGKNGSIDFKGIDAEFTFNEKDALEHIGSGKWVMNVKPIEIKPKDDQGSITLQAFDIEQSLTTSGDFDLKISPIKVDIIDNEGENFVIDIDGITEKGEKVKFDPNLGNYLGEVSGKVGDISVTEKEGKTILGNIDFGSKAIKNDQGNYDLGGNFDFNFDGKNLQERFKLPLLLKNFSTNTTVTNLSPEFFEIATKLAQLQQVEDKEAKEKAIYQSLNAFTNNLSLNKTHIDGALTLQTDKGDANINFNLSPRAGELGTDIDWKNLTENAERNPMVVLATLQKNVDFKLDISVNRDILSAIGMAELVEMQGGNMIENKDGILTIHLENSSEGFKINGKPML